ncbi:MULTISPECIES: ABC transporter substrate-binding protein [Roseovarius]|jgi:branched-chain amino acid transport system substrate-binding protein|uniref:ABC transporter substrate-binding protein n=2 Tax=Roseovarius nubinhibens TaxID=314263 RepID=A0A348WA40_9RHOB|nr:MULTISPECIES: ABC transporter substrate-binding protein [Roseovarius]EAP77432.1 probable substrate-binding protein [Roseovarius nubinhibens ISM]MAO26785.1 ABC transporter substrate-binding protein [Roseovarius sp.]MAZ21242.1 ABC transporter substrate-binding protein [Roseovarius sp.]MBU2999854.1 ABC transporter substrate-binding protein [Roseovarius nubinhibens]HAR51402.1 ABC transporter substrate-binding protein [Roseovarius nubinhibens]|tara:strand:+ start:1116 stop:2279 length:1164 start_codon:yes stop_codon:yes gene_type:complete
MKRTLLASLMAATCLTGAASAAEDKIKIGLIYTLSGPAAALGEQGRDGFLLAADQIGKIGGLETEIIVIDDERKPDLAASKARELVERDEVDFVVGPIFSNILIAIHKPVTESGAILISSNAGTSNFAGKDCHPNFFVTSYQNDQNHEVMGAYAEKQGYQNVFLMAPNYQAGIDSLNGFKRSYSGGVAGEVYTELGQLDFSSELSQIAAFQPDALFTFMPGGMGVNLVKQYNQAGLGSIPFLSAFTVDETTLPATQDAAVGFLGGATWAPDMDNEANKTFVSGYEEKYGHVPGTYAMQAYDAAQLIDSAVRKVEGNLEDKDALRAALKEADFASPRGDFTFGNNNYPIQDFYLVKAVKREDGKYATSMVERIFDDYQDNYAAECDMK